jgi:predicted small secreted protein
MIKRLMLTALATAIVATTIAETDTAHFIVETHSVRATCVDYTLPVTFKLDSTSGNIWRFTGTDFVQIPVAGTWSAGVNQGSGIDTEEQRRSVALLKKMNELVIPEINFRQVNIYDAIAFLQEASIKQDPEKRGISIIGNIGTPPVQTNDPFAVADEDGFPLVQTDGDEDGWVPLITFSSRNITFYEALKIVTEVANMRYRITGDVVMIVPFVYPMGEIVISVYDFLPSTVERIQNCQPELFETNMPPATAENSWKKFFSESGVSWPCGTYIKPLPLIGKVVVCNTYQNLAVFEQVMEAINTYPPRPGRFRLISAEGTSPTALLLLDSNTGHAWQYDIFKVAEDGKTIHTDSFFSIPEREKTPN